MWLQAPNLSCKHGFSTRHGGISPAPFNSLNLGGSADSPANISENRTIALLQLQLDPLRLNTLRQVHSDKICNPPDDSNEGDALVSTSKEDVLGIMVADCYPVLYYDAHNAVIAAAHCGWRGTLAGLAGKTVDKMCDLGADRRHIQAAVGQGISQEQFEVGPDVIAAFQNAGYPPSFWNSRKLDLLRCILFNLNNSGIPAQNIWAMRRCSFEPDFFSYRRDKGKTGRMMAVISMQTI